MPQPAGRPQRALDTIVRRCRAALHSEDASPPFAVGEGFGQTWRDAIRPLLATRSHARPFQDDWQYVYSAQHRLKTAVRVATDIADYDEWIKADTWDKLVTDEPLRQVGEIVAEAARQWLRAAPATAATDAAATRLADELRGIRSTLQSQQCSNARTFDGAIRRLDMAVVGSDEEA